MTYIVANAIGNLDIATAAALLWLVGSLALIVMALRRRR
jgi:hypothetical protein